MSEIINKFHIFHDFPPNLTQNIKSFYVSRDRLDIHFCYCVLNDNKVYGLGEDIHQKVGYNPTNDKYVLINELSDKNIQEFYYGHYFIFARNDQNDIFSWGWNNCGQLGRGFKSDPGVYLKPEKISFFDGKNIIQISCGLEHCLALSADGVVYGWGQNNRGQVGCGHEEDIVFTPIEIVFKERIKFIHCTSFMSFVVSFNGNAYYWGEFNLLCQCHYQPVMLNLSFKVKSILNTMDQKYLFVLSFEGVIYKLPETNNKIELQKFWHLNDEDEIISLCVDDNSNVICQTPGGVYSIRDSAVKTSYKTLFEYLLFEERQTYKTIHIKENQLFVLVYESNEKDSEYLVKTIALSEKNIQQNDMNLSLRKFRISNDLPQILDSNVKYYYQSGSSKNSYMGLFVTYDNKVYGWGSNYFGKLGFGQVESIFEYTEIAELRDQNIQEFYEGNDFMHARNVNNEIFSWGRNDLGQLARGFKSPKGKYLTPEKVLFLDGKNIIQISCGLGHCLALSADYVIYGWGQNDRGQVGCGQGEDIVSTPIEIVLKERIKFIHGTMWLSFAVSFDGYAYYWGKNDKSREYLPKLISLEDVLKIFYSDSCKAFIILNSSGEVFVLTLLDEKIEKIKSDEEFFDLYCEYDSDYFPNCVLKAPECVYQLENKILIKTNFYNFFDYYSQKSEYLKKAIEITKDGYLRAKEIQFNEEKKILNLTDQLIFKSKYENNFDVIEEKGKGGFGTVLKVKKKSNNIVYALKRIKINDDLDIKEIKIMSDLNTDFVVQYIDSWIEMIPGFNIFIKFQFIQMELCSQNLRDFINLTNGLFDKKFQTFNYFISCELFKELIECVNYLHSLKPPIIHRDLKPENILVSDNIINGRFLKLSDFGLSQIHDKSSHTRMVGTDAYMAPEG